MKHVSPFPLPSTLKKAGLTACLLLAGGWLAKGAGAPPVTLEWLGGKPPVPAAGVSWGVPWARGTMARDASLAVRTADGRAIPTQTWPLAFWPDGSLKWSGLAIASGPELAGPLTLETGTPPAPASPVTVTEDAAAVEVATGPLRCRLPKSGTDFLESLTLDGRAMGQGGHLIVVREDRSKFEAEGTLREEEFSSRIDKVTVEQSGPVRAVVRVEGMHEGGTPRRAWLPFTLRLYFTAGVDSVRIVHSFVFDGDEQTDFIRGLGIAFRVPFREELQNRHVRFATGGDDLWSEPVMMSPGYRDVLVKNARAMNLDQLAGKRIPNLDQLDPKTRAQFETVAVWSGFRLTQSGPDSFSLDKRTNPQSSWLHAMSERRAGGFAFLGDVSGGLAVGVQHFWQKYPAEIEIEDAASPAARLVVWLWSPEAAPMDLRHYDTVGHDGSISYEDHQEGFSTAHGVANTSELTLWALPNTPANAVLAPLAKAADEPPMLVCTPSYYHSVPVFGTWSLPDRSTPDGAAVETEIDRALAFYQGEIDRRRWYGFWNYGDVMRTYDSQRHVWMYDIGGHAWNNTELMPDAWIWYSFLRTGRGDIFRLGEAMTRNTSEVDVYHLGRFVGLGSRHNVSHWGCGAKEARISEAFLKRFYYYLTTDERTGDLMRETLDVDRTIAAIQPVRKIVTRPDVPDIIRVGPEWEAMASNWMTEWERTGNVKYRDQILAGMESIGAMPDAFVTRLAFGYDLKTKRLSDIGEPNMKAGEFLDLFGGDQIVAELKGLIDCPEFNRAWDHLNEKWARDPRWNGYTKARVLAYFATVSGDRALRDQSRQLLQESLQNHGHDAFPASPPVVDGPDLPEPTVEIPAVMKLATPGVAQWGLNLIMATEWNRQFDAAHEKPAPAKSDP